MTRIHWTVCGAVAVCLGAGLAFWCFALGPMYSHQKWSKRVRADIYSLADKRPPEINRGQWEFAIGWTINLHANCATSYTWVDRREMEPFADELERRIRGPVDMSTIEWIWDEYVRITRHGREYSDRYRPSRSEGWQRATEGWFGIPVN